MRLHIRTFSLKCGAEPAALAPLTQTLTRLTKMVTENATSFTNLKPKIYGTPDPQKIKKVEKIKKNKRIKRLKKVKRLKVKKSKKVKRLKRLKG